MKLCKHKRVHLCWECKSEHEWDLMTTTKSTVPYPHRKPCEKHKWSDFPTGRLKCISSPSGASFSLMVEHYCTECGELEWRGVPIEIPSRGHTT